jgi:hypothetical protein
MVKIPPISIKQTITSHVKQLNTKRQHTALEIQVLTKDKPRIVFFSMF